MSERDDVAIELERYLETQHLANPWTTQPGATTRMLYATLLPGQPDGVYAADRARYQADLASEALAGRPASRSGTATLVVTAGPPGAGKTSALSRMPEISDFRRIDADVFKDRLLRDARDMGLLDRHLERHLADGRPIRLRELAGFVHAESTAVAAAARRAAFEAREDVVVEGTLNDLAAARDLLRELSRAGYERLRILSLTVSYDEARERVLERWWDARGTEEGERLVSEGALQAYFDGDGRARSAEVAAQLEQAARSLFGFDVAMVTT